ncbi:hypothetical protein LZ24_00259 [Desulfobotulus alkaliphilus]|uniref:Uncharacterized protein n=1 Tax=Desulfobotulus alkaliphilus TaxID=622671 RepID=A0A562S7U9_9BACT|nr:hypothetical protein [Desulfobotulus alkaliphilus]TWI77449.1 hypothetical protein LZ24_00259 [Desulfobotulus alkaliphilus]
MNSLIKNSPEAIDRPPGSHKSPFQSFHKLKPLAPAKDAIFEYTYRTVALAVAGFMAFSEAVS